MLLAVLSRRQSVDAPARIRSGLACLLALQVTAGTLRDEPTTRDAPRFRAQATAFDASTRQLEVARDAEGRAQVALDWLRALKNVLNAVPIDSENRAAPYREWLDARDDLIVYSEPSGEWLIQDTVIWNLHDTHRTTASADDIAWLAVINRLPGECEGYVPCYAFGLNHLEGEYLRRQPKGRHHAEALDSIVAALDNARDLVSRPDGSDFLKVPDACGDLEASLVPLRRAVAAISHARVADTLAAIDRLAAYCLP
jgi:hypothetical protein